MLRNSSKAARSFESSPVQTSKRHCHSRAFQQNSNESLLWPENDDSFLVSAKIVDILCDRKAENKQSCNTNFHDTDSDDNLFNDIKLPTTPTTAARITTSVADDTIFAEINLDDLTKNEKEEIFQNTDDYKITSGEIVSVQSTQRFLDDVFKVPRQVKQLQQQWQAQKQQENAEDSFLTISIIEGIVQGTQYETYEEIQNRTIVQQKTLQIDNQELDMLANLNWETQEFSNMYVFPSKGPFYGLPERVKHLIFEHKGIKSLYEWQDECLNLPAIPKRKNLIYALPTSGGKTLVAEILILRELLCRRKNVIFILPYVSIVQEKVSAMSPFAIAFDFIVDEYTSGKGKCPPVERKKRKSLFIASIEKGAILMDSLIEAERANEIGLVVVDELHLIGERGRGATLEAFLTKVMFLNANIQIVGMSATIGNLSEISAFLNADVYTRGFRPVELKEYIKCGRDLLEINAMGNSLEEIFVYKRSVNFNYSEAVARADPDHLAGLVTECAPEQCCLIFCPTRKNCENVAILLSRILPRNKFLSHRKTEKADLMDALDKVCGILSPVLAKTIPYGIAYHHSGLTADERKFIETAYRFGVISVVCCTSTLAAGVNLPAKRVIIRAPYVGAEFMTLCKYKQMVGRAGRAGLGEAGESIMIASSRDNVRVGEMLFSPMDKALSSLDQQNCMGLQALILSAIGLGLACCRRDLCRLINRTLLAVQAKALEISVEDLILRIVRAMFKNRVLELAVNERGINCTDIQITQDVNKISQQDKNNTLKRPVYIGKSTRFQLTTIGKAAFKAGIDYKRAYAIHNELKFAQKQLILTNYAHLLYLVVAFNSNEKGDELFAANASILFNLYTNLDEHTHRLFNMFGFTEAQAAKLMKTNTVQGPLELKLNRLFKVLILVDILNVMPLPEVADKYNVERGTLQSLISQATSASSAIVRLCEQMGQFWCYKPLFERITAKMDRCGTMELEPLLDLPAVKINRAKQLYAAGFRTIEDMAKLRPRELVQSVAHMPLKIAKEIVSAAKIMIMKKLDHLEEETEALKVCLNSNKNDD